ncbi:MAG: DUF6443 domain-containing protein, partial [Bacteroidota bacterium]
MSKFFYLTCYCLGLSIHVLAQSNDQNYIITYTPREAKTTEAKVTFTSPATEVAKTIEYVDGLGRALQTISKEAAPSGNDMVQPHEYDAFGRKARSYLPYARPVGTDGTFQVNAVVDQDDFYQNPPTAVESDREPYAVTEFEPSPLNRVDQQGSPGDDWQPNTGRAIGYQYLVNDGSAVYQVQQWSLSAAGIPSSTQFYGTGELTVTEMEDEDGRIHREYTDKLGRMVLKQVQNSSTSSDTYDTYYIYDEYDLLRVVLPPEAAENLTPVATLRCGRPDGQ